MTRGIGKVLKVLGRTPILSEPGEGALDHPAARWDDEAFVASLEPGGERVWTYKEAMVPAAIPKSLLVVGSGAIGIEFASFYHDMGAEVTVVEVLDRVLRSRTRRSPTSLASLSRNKGSTFSA